MRTVENRWIRARRLSVRLAAVACAGGVGLISLVQAQVTHNVSDVCYNKIATVFKAAELGALVEDYIDKKIQISQKKITGEAWINEARALSQYKIGPLAPPGGNVVHHHTALGEHIMEGFCGYTKKK